MSEPDAPPTRAAADPPPLRRTPHPPLPARAPREPDHYRLYPTAPLPSGAVAGGYDAVAARLAEFLAGGGTVLLDGDVGVLWASLRSGLTTALTRHGLEPAWIDVRDAMRPPGEIDARLAPYLPDDPLFGTRYPGGLIDLFDPGRLAGLAARVPGDAPAIVFGPGAALLRGAARRNPAPTTAPTTAYVEVPKNEIQYRARAGSVANLGAPESGDADPKQMYRRFYFVDWIVGNRHKRALLPELALLIDAQRPDDPAAVSGDDLRAGLAALARRPFRARPWFEPGAWGGQWLKERIPELPREVPNYAWSFELIVPENGVVFEDAGNGRLLEVSFDLVMFQEAERVLGRHAARFGSDFPIRFDFLDTVGGGNLSLQCHPSPAFIRERFGEPFTQDETYYMLHAEPGSRVYLGFEEDVDPGAFRAAVERSAREGSEVDVDRWVRSLPARTHDLFLIPHGTIHCSGAGNVVLEISATPYIFTFKIYDWLRLDLDGSPRPLNIDRAFENLDFSRRGAVVDETLVARPREIAAGDGWRVVHLPTHPDHFYDVHRIEFDGAADLGTDGSCHVLSLVEGERMRVEWEGGSDRYHFAETVVVPAAVDRYRLRSEDGSPLKVVKAFLKEDPM